MEVRISTIYPPPLPLLSKRPKTHHADIDRAAIDIEDILETIAFLHGKKWTSMLIKRTYFGNWLRDYSQAVDVGSLKGVNAATIRILVRPLSPPSWHALDLSVKLTRRRFGSCPSWPLAMLPRNLK